MAKKEKGKRKFSTIFFILVILAGLSLVLYPTVSNYIHSLSYHKVIEDYSEAASRLDKESYNRILESAHSYNAELAENSTIVYTLSDEQRKEYESLLNIMGDGVMGYIDIPKSNINLPIYHGTSEAVLQSGVGHYEGSSLPVGGESVHTILSGHTGLPSSKLFTDIRELEVGDKFTLHVLNETLTYEIENIEVVLPEELSKLKIEKGKDLCTLFTCTPYGVNTHRLVVRAHRTENEKTSSNKSGQDEEKNNITKWILIIAAAILLLGLIIVIFIVKRKKRKNDSIS